MKISKDASKMEHRMPLIEVFFVGCAIDRKINRIKKFNILSLPLINKRNRKMWEFV